MSPRQASIYMVFSAVLWGTHPTLIQLADWTPFGTAWIRGVFCALLVLIYIATVNSFSFKSPWVQLLCGIFLAANSLLFVSASLFTTPANAVLLMFIFPWITMSLDFALNNITPAREDLYRLLLGVVGIAIIVSGGLGGEGSLGDILAILAGISIALHIFFSQKLRQAHGANKEVLNAVLIAWIATTIALAPFSILSPTPDKTQIVYLVVFGVLSAIPWLLWGKSIAYLSGHVVGALLGVEVFVAAVCGWLFLDESPDPTTWIGGFLTLAAAIWQISAGSASRQEKD